MEEFTSAKKHYELLCSERSHFHLTSGSHGFWPAVIEIYKKLTDFPATYH